MSVVVPSVAQSLVDEQASAQNQRRWLRVTSDRVNLRSRADANSRIVGRVNKDDVLEAVGREYSWQRIVPPKGVYLIVASEYINRLDARRGVVNVDTTLRARVGSDIQPRDPQLSEVQTLLQSGAEVEIVGVLNDQWLKIVPPTGTYVYISSDFAEEISADAAKRLLAAHKPTTEARSGWAEAVGVRSSGSRSVAAAPKPETTQKPSPAAAAAAPGNPPPTGATDTVYKVGIEPPSAAGVRHLVDMIPSSQPTGSRVPTTRPAAATAAIKPPGSLTMPARVQTPTTNPASATRASSAPVQRVKRVIAAESGFDVGGILRPCYTLELGPYGLRYSVQDPITKHVRAYIEIPSELGFSGPGAVGKYVGVCGEWQTDARTGVKILRARSVTVLNPRKR